MFNRQFHKQLSVWGKSNRVSPNRKEEILSLILSHVRPGEGTQNASMGHTFEWLFFGTSALTILLLTVLNPFGSTSNPVKIGLPDLFRSGPAVSSSGPNTLSKERGFNLSRDFSTSGSVDHSPSISTTKPVTGNSASSPDQAPSTQGLAENKSGSSDLVYLPPQEKQAPATHPTTGFEKGVPLPIYPPSRSVPEISVSDPREFLKIYYSAKIKTRNVAETSKRASVIIRGYGGRVDSATVGEKFGSISFAVPKSNFETFRNEISTLGGARFVVENIETQNLLSEKRGIEQNLSANQDLNSQLQKDKSTTASRHAATVRAIESGINSISSQIAQVRTDIDKGRGNIVDLENWLIELERQKSNLVSQLGLENSRYAKTQSSLNEQIESTKQVQDSLKQQDIELQQKVDSVSGTITFSWISIWSYINIYTNGYWLPSLAAFAALCLYVLYKRKKRTPLEVIL